ncbi:MAG: two-component regulator propeller domain-containing protein [Bacteroidota bacterium]
MIRIKEFALTAIALLFCIAACAQKTEIFDKSNSQIADNNLGRILLDRKGNLWIGTLKSGLIKYDGTNFTESQAIGTGSYPSIEPLLIDSKGNIWVSYSGTKRGIAMFDGTKWTDFSDYCQSAICAAEGRDGKLFFGNMTGVMVYDGSKWEKYALPNESVYSYNVMSLAISRSGQMAFGCSAYLLLYDGKNWKSLNEQNSELRVGTVRSVKYLDNGALYIGYGGGFGAGGFSILQDAKWKHFDKNNSTFPDQMVRDIEVAKSGVIWMATNDGLVKVDVDKFQTFKLRPGRFANVIMGITLQDDNTIWATTTNGLVKVTE